jgi:hypothetical protein
MCSRLIHAHQMEIATLDSIASLALKDFQALDVLDQPLQTNSSSW